MEDNLTTIEDANHNTTSFTYDAFGRVTQTTFPSGYVETHGYDADNNLTTTTDRKNQLLAGGEALTADFDFGGAAPFAFKGAGFEFLLRSLRSLRSTLVSLSHQTTKFPPTPSISSTSPRLIRMISTQVLYLDSNPFSCYHSPCFARAVISLAQFSVVFVASDL